jgi:hypothetical protein
MATAAAAAAVQLQQQVLLMRTPAQRCEQQGSTHGYDVTRYQCHDHPSRKFLRLQLVYDSRPAEADDQPEQWQLKVVGKDQRQVWCCRLHPVALLMAELLQPGRPHRQGKAGSKRHISSLEQAAGCGDA